MEKFNRILAVIDPTQTEQKALNRAIELASKTGASVTAIMTIFDFSYEMTTMLSSEERQLMQSAVIDDRSNWLEGILDKKADQASQLHARVLWHNRPYQAILETVLKDNYDLVIKATHEHDVLKSVIFTPTDWHLLRKCPVPLLLVKEHAWPENSKIIAAVNVSSDEAEHRSLNKKIIEQAKSAARVLHSDAILVNCYPGTPVSLAVEIPEFDPSSYIESIRQHHLDAMQTYADQYQVKPEHCVVEEGLAEEVVPKLSTEMDAELVVLGTIGRTGLSAAIIGNTAEHMLDAINCDVLALKPEGYVCPIKLNT
ncbi:universal stress protein UspE [Saccharobesus litoralis]|uniref:Universal stress protein UspE n=1 Tax=Saccharobesus litoralis TaxID=2172099 RepID=A0A2S0VSZ2_9ALTE|nr:universal stress protein UspE [Saccharobesus litoralis]AWB67329.1 universal stress protein UspE [Saccharobesus litoralis]